MRLTYQNISKAEAVAQAKLHRGDMNWHTDWQRAEAITAWGTPFSFHRRKTFAIRSALLALLAFTVQWGLFDLALEVL